MQLQISNLYAASKSARSMIKQKKRMRQEAIGLDLKQIGKKSILLQVIHFAFLAFSSI
jgi:hypothetical protein